MLSYMLCKIQSDTLGVGGATIFKVKSVTIIPSLPYCNRPTQNWWYARWNYRLWFAHLKVNSPYSEFTVIAQHCQSGR